MTDMSDDNRGNAGKLSKQTDPLETAVANERVLLAKLKVKRNRLAGQAGYQRLLTALERDVSRQLTKLQNQQNTVNRKSA